MSKVVTGNRAKVYIEGALVGIFDSCNYSSGIATEDVFILGASAAREIAITAQEPVSLNCSGFRIAGNGVHVLPRFPRLGDLLNFQSLTITIVDRKTGTTLLTVLGVVPVNNGENYSAKQISKINCSFKGIRGFDESGDSDESDAADLP